MNASATYRDRIYEKYSTNFQDAATTFDVAASRKWGRAYRYYFRAWLPDRKDAAILDVGCGAGKLLHHFREKGYRNVLGVDVSPEQVQISRQVVPDVAEENALDFLERNKEAFDLITGLDIIEHLHKPEVLRFMDAAFAGLKPGGRLILQTPNADSVAVGTIRYGDFTHEVCFNPNSLLRLMALACFTRIEAREMGPVPWGHSVTSTVRAGIWQTFRVVFKVWNLAEFGTAGSGIFTRVFLISGVKR